MLLDVLVTDDAAGVRGGELDALGALVAEDLKLVKLISTASFSFSFHFLAIGSDGPGPEEGKLRLVIEFHGRVTVILASFGAQELVGAAMPGFDVAIVLDGGLLVIEKDDGDGVLGIVRESLVRGGAQPFRGGIGEHTGEKRLETDARPP